MPSLGAVIQSLREERGVTQGQLATYAGLSPGYLSLIERGQRETLSADRLARVARRLGVSSEYLLEQGGRLPPRPQIDHEQEILDRLVALARSDEVTMEVVEMLVELTPERRRFVAEWVRYQRARQRGEDGGDGAEWR